MSRLCWRYPGLLLFCFLSLLFTVLTVLLSDWLMPSGVPKNLVLNCATNIGELITLVLLPHINR